MAVHTWIPSNLDLSQQIVVEFCPKDCMETFLQASKNFWEPWRTERDGRKKSPDFLKNYFDLTFNSRILRNHTKLGGYIEKMFKNVLWKDHSFKPFILEVIETQSWLFGKICLFYGQKCNTFIRKATEAWSCAINERTGRVYDPWRLIWSYADRFWKIVVK